MIKEIINFILHIDSFFITLIQSYGNLVYLLLFFIIFLETGFVLTPFLPGDSLLFISGAFAAAGFLNVYILFFILSVAAIIGDTINYWIGNYFGERVFLKFIKKEHIERTKLFFHHHGKKTIVLARFVPIIRTFAPFVAGIGKMNYFTFLSYNIIGGVFWVALFVFLGFYFGNISYVKDNLTLIVFLVIILSLIPAFWEYIKHRRKNKLYK
ncbi:VTT domain-containing protein [Candidatus Woesearchaeota archaeon]|nr:VTT domain-containing protein [Candidatus Woesearchaeota archaeon]